VKKIIISACLVGLNTRYDGGNNYSNVFSQLVKTGQAVPFCPEQCGGLPTPRQPSEIVGGDGKDVLSQQAKVISKEGIDVTKEFLKGAKETLKLAKITGATEAILKSRSPSCGCKKIYDGTFNDVLIEGMGVTAAYLKAHGLNVIDSEDYMT